MFAVDQGQKSVIPRRADSTRAVNRVVKEGKRHGLQPYKLTQSPSLYTLPQFPQNFTDRTDNYVDP